MMFPKKFCDYSYRISVESRYLEVQVLSEIFRDIRTSTNQICNIGEKNKSNNHISQMNMKLEILSLSVSLSLSLSVSLSLSLSLSLSEMYLFTEDNKTTSSCFVIPVLSAVTFMVS